MAGLQFHIESTDDSINRLVKNCRDELVEGRYIQNPDEMRGQMDKLQEIRGLIWTLLDNFEKKP